MQESSGPDTFDESRLVMILLTHLRVTWILYSFRLVLEGNAGKEIPESSRLVFLEKFLTNKFALLEVEDGNSSNPLNRGVVADLPLLRTLLAICQSQETQVYFILDAEDLFCWYYWKRWFLWAMSAAQTAENHGDEWNLT